MALQDKINGKNQIHGNEKYNPNKLCYKLMINEMSNW